MSKNKNYPFNTRLRYAIDNFMSRGSSSIFLALLCLFLFGFLVMVLIRSIVNTFMPDETLSSWGEIPWRVYVAVMEGSAAETDGDSNWLAKITSILGVLVGLVLFSSMVAFITSVFTAKLDELRRGRSLVLENDHTLILGFGDRILEVIRELIEANESEPDAAIVILADNDKEEMDNMIRDNISDFVSTRVITRSGVVTNINNLKKVMAADAKSVIIMNSAASWQPEDEKNLADALVLKSIMSIIAVCDGDEHPPIVCEIHSDRDRSLAENISNGDVKALNEVSVLSRMIAQLALSRNGLSVVYSDMVGFDGNEFYFYQPDDGWGGPLNFGESINRFNSSTPMGIHNADGQIILNPPKETPVNDDDELIIFAEDDSTIFYFNEPVFQPKVDKIPTSEMKPRSHRIALLNWTTKTGIILEKLCSYLPEGSELCTFVSAILPEMDILKDSLSESYPHINISINKIKKKYIFSNKNKKILFIGNLKYLPNKLAIKNFIKNTLPKLEKKIPGVNLEVIGDISKINKVLLSSHKRVKFLGVKKNIDKFIKGSFCGLANLTISTGMQGKILSYMSYGLPVICSKKVASNFNKNVLSYSDDNELINKIVSLKNNKKVSTLISKKSLRFINNFTWKKIAKKYLSIIKN